MTRMREQPRAVLERQIELLERGDVDGLVNQYHHDALLLRFDTSARGHDQIRSLLAEYVSRGPRLKSLDAYGESDDILSYQATMMLGGAEIHTYGVFFLRDGKIWRQFAGILSSGGP
jgi:hypothetical protein